MIPYCRSSSTAHRSGAGSRDWTGCSTTSSRATITLRPSQPPWPSLRLLTALIGQTVKLRWKLSLQVRGNGAIRTIAADYYAQNRRRARPHPCLGQLRRRPADRRPPFRSDRRGLFRHSHRPGRGQPALSGDHAADRRVAVGLRRHLFCAIRTAANQFFAVLRPLDPAGSARRVARRRDHAANPASPADVGRGRQRRRRPDRGRRHPARR